MPITVPTNNPEFHSFITSHHFDKNLQRFGHTIAKDEQGEPQLLVEGTLIPWEKVKSRIKYHPDKGRLEEWDYQENGLVPHSRTGWVTLKPFRTLPEGERPDSPKLILMSACKGDMPGLFSNYGHSWINLITTEGKVYSFGFYAPEDFIHYPDKPIRTLEAVLHNPDPYEFLPGRTRESVSWDISQEKLEAVILLVETYQSCGLHYNGLEQNCADFVRAILNFAVFDTPEKQEKEPVDFSVGWYSALPKGVQGALNWVWVHTPSPLQKIVGAIWKRVVALALSPLMLSMGGFSGYWLTDEKTQEAWEVEAVLPSIWRLLNYKVVLNHNMGVRRWMRQQPSCQRVNLGF